VIIQVTTATGRGPTRFAARDAALIEAGVADRNVIPVGAVLPPGSEVEPVHRIACPPGVWGDRLYCVVARAQTARAEMSAWAGLGWAQDESGRGLLVAQTAADEPTLRDRLDDSLTGCCYRRGLSLPFRAATVVGARCTGDPVCALVVAVFEAATWRSARPVAAHAMFG
jgi:arginine decarboxylase